MSAGGFGCQSAREKFRLLTLYQRFEHLVIVLLTALIAVIVMAAVWNLTIRILVGLILSGSLDPSDYSTFQVIFGMIFTVMIAPELIERNPFSPRNRAQRPDVRSAVPRRNSLALFELRRSKMLCSSMGID
jgi:hypothetical protein